MSQIDTEECNGVESQQQTAQTFLTNEIISEITIMILLGLSGLSSWCFAHERQCTYYPPSLI